MPKTVLEPVKYFCFDGCFTSSRSKIITALTRPQIHNFVHTIDVTFQGLQKSDAIIGKPLEKYWKKLILMTFESKRRTSLT